MPVSYVLNRSNHRERFSGLFYRFNWTKVRILDDYLGGKVVRDALFAAAVHLAFHIGRAKSLKLNCIVSSNPAVV